MCPYHISIGVFPNPSQFFKPNAFNFFQSEYAHDFYENETEYYNANIKRIQDDFNILIYIGNSNAIFQPILI